jgi:predicted DNA-binding protein with PD1-like motif
MEVTMEAKTLAEEAGQRTYAVIFESGDEVRSGLEGFAREEGLSAASIQGIGALSDVTLGYFNWETKEYDEIACDEQVEVVSLVGDVALKDGDPAVHAHLAVARSDATVLGGHLLAAHVRPTLEVVVVESPRHLRKQHDPTTGLALISVK